MEAIRKTIPAMMPIQCSLVRAELTTDPARCRVGRTEKTVGASTKAKKMSPPSQTISDSIIMKRRNDMGAIIGCGLLAVGSGLWALGSGLWLWAYGQLAPSS